MPLIRLTFALFVAKLSSEPHRVVTCPAGLESYPASNPGPATVTPPSMETDQHTSVDIMLFLFQPYK